MNPDEEATEPACGECQGLTSANCPIFRSPENECASCGGCYCDGAC